MRRRPVLLAVLATLVALIYCTLVVPVRLAWRLQASPSDSEEHPGRVFQGMPSADVDKLIGDIPRRRLSGLRAIAQSGELQFVDPVWPPRWAWVWQTGPREARYFIGHGYYVNWPVWIATLALVFAAGGVLTLTTYVRTRRRAVE